MVKKTSKGLCLVLVIALCLSLCAVCFAEIGSGFTDVLGGEYYYDAVKEMCETGIINGYGDGTFKPTNSVKNSEALKMICTSAEINYPSAIGCWYESTFSWAFDHYIIDRNLEIENNASRRELCTWIVNTYKIDVKENKTNNKGIDFIDLTEGNDLYIVNTLADLGIINGIPTGNGIIFGGDRNVTRADLCVMLNRLNKQNIDKPVWSPEESAFEPGNSVEGLCCCTSATVDEIEELCAGVWEDMMFGFFDGVTTQDIVMEKGATVDDIDRIMENTRKQFKVTTDTVPFISYFLDQYDLDYEVNMDGNEVKSIKIMFKLSNSEGLQGAYLLNAIYNADEEIRANANKLISDEIINYSMSGKEVLDTLADFIALNFEHDTIGNNANMYKSLGDRQLTDRGYSVLLNRLGSFSGRYYQVVSGTMDGEPHTWILYEVDGQKYYCDMALADTDSEDGCNMDYIAIPENEIENYKGHNISIDVEK